MSAARPGHLNINTAAVRCLHSRLRLCAGGGEHGARGGAGAGLRWRKTVVLLGDGVLWGADILSAQ